LNEGISPSSLALTKAGDGPDSLAMVTRNTEKSEIQTKWMALDLTAEYRKDLSHRHLVKHL
jgi:hypothetical protein